MQIRNKILGVFSEPPKVTFSQSNSYSYLDQTLLANGKPNWEMLHKKYGSAVYIGFDKDGKPLEDNSPPWQEIVFASPNPIIVGDKVSVNGMKIDSYTIQALRRRKVKFTGITENASHGFLVKDGYFLVGVRGGQDQVGTLNPLPAGAQTWKDHYTVDPITDGFMDEAYGEAGTTVDNLRLRGVFNQIGIHINRQWAFTATPNKDLVTIVNLHEKGLELYKKEKRRHGNEAKARQALAESEFPTDAWESNNLLPLRFSPELFLRLLRDKSNEGIPLIGSMYGSLYVIGVSEWGEDFKKEAQVPEITLK